MSNQNSSRRGFTLIELAITILIMGVLAAVAVPRLTTQIEKTKRTADVQSALELSHILERSFIDETIKFPEGDSSASSMSVAVIVSNDGVNYYRGSGAVLVNNQNWEDDKASGEEYRRIHKIFTAGGFTGVPVQAHVENGGWACYGVALFSTGNTRIFSSAESSQCVSAANGDEDSFNANNLNSSSNPIAAYLPKNYINN